MQALSLVRSLGLCVLGVLCVTPACAPEKTQTPEPSKSPPDAQAKATDNAGDKARAKAGTTAGDAAPRAALRALGTRLAHGETRRLAPLPGRREGRVDVAACVARLRECGADGFVYDIGDGDKDWEDCGALAKGFAAAELKLWVTIRLPDHQANSMPYRGNFDEWARQVAGLAKKHESVVAFLLRELEQGRNSRFVHAGRAETMRKILNAEGVSLLASVHDPEDTWIEMFKDSLDGVSLRWTKFNQLSNFTGMLSGLKALCPKEWKRYVTLETRAWGGSRNPPDPILTMGSLKAASTRTDGVLLRQLDLRKPALHSKAASGNSVYFETLRAFSQVKR